MTDPWGLDQPPADGDAGIALSPRLTRLAEVQASGIAITDVDPDAQDFPAAEDLPEVQALTSQGWVPLEAAPLYCLLPAAWPPEHRTWVPDRLPKVGMRSTSDDYWGDIVAIPDDDWFADLSAGRARSAGLPDPPAGRIWLLRSPWPRIPVSVILNIIWAVVKRRRVDDEQAEFYRAATDVLTWDERQALDGCPADIRELVDAWADVGRVGEAASEVIARQLQPADLEDALHRTQLDEPTVLAWQTSLQTDLDDDVVDFINAWRASGLPGNPPPGAGRYLERSLDELGSWLGADFDLYAAAKLEHAGLGAAIRWRDAGFSAADTYELLRSDPVLTPEEAQAFDDTGAARERRRDWIHYGFSAREAADWADAGLTPYLARLWRACGKQPIDVRAGQQLPPQLLDGRRYLTYSRSRDGERGYSQFDELPDPPGTRGRGATARHA